MHTAYNITHIRIYYKRMAEGGIGLADEVKNEQKIKKAKPRRKRSMFSKFVSLVVIGFSLFLLYGVGKEVLTTMELKQQITAVQEQLKTLEEENKYLTLQRDKLEDPAYVQSYARGSFMLSKEGEQIFYLPSDDKK